ncbi:MAG TPA: chemotaxis-specific protein-glutamate methyltransferase CheB [Vicinamibacterales bacterium]|jgi:two-component system chemotaxis response regulator CheB|nr:chemotaxis-specific protein-glutamate methyltransferase CheB [Vicinamibacterales bacterium]
MSSIVRILIVDDSAYVRKVIRQMLSRSPFFEIVGTARDGREALEMAEELRPDVVTCDLIMPELDGVGFIKAQMARRPIPIVVVSVASESGELVLSALDAGAVDFVQKPTALATDRVFEIADELIEKVKGAAAARPTVHADIQPQAISRPAAARSVDVVVIGISTGGPQALKMLIPRLPAELPVPIAIVLHMPVGYTELYAKKLNEQSALTVLESQGEEVVRKGTVYLAPAGRHLTLRRLANGDVVTNLDVRPLDTLYRPSVDTLFQSAADVYGSRVLGIVMTGMGHDGREGAAWIKAKGGIVLTESEESCVVYGMPRSIVEAGLSDGNVGLDLMADALLARV